MLEPDVSLHTPNPRPLTDDPRFPGPDPSSIDTPLLHPLYSKLSLYSLLLRVRATSPS